MEEGDDNKGVSVAAQRGRVSWKRRGDFADHGANALLSRIEGGDLEGLGDPVKENPVREIVRVSFGSAGEFFVKRFKTRHWRDVAKLVIRGSRAQKEWRMAAALLEARIPAVEVVAAGERRKGWLPVETYLVTPAIPGVMSLREFGFSRLGGPILGSRPPWLTALIEELAGLTRRLHERGFYHRDFHGGNVLLRVNGTGRAGDKVSLFVVDLHSMRRLKSVSRPRRVKMLGVLRNSLGFPGVSATDRLRFLRAYLGPEATRETVSAWAWEVTRSGQRIQRRYLQSRTRRCLVESKSFTNERTRIGRLFRRREYLSDQIVRAIEEHRAAVGRGEALKISLETNVSMVKAAGVSGRLCVKEFRYRGFLHRLKDLVRASPAKRSWVASQALKFRKVGAASAVALVQSSVCSRRSHYFITAEVAGAEAMDRYVKREFAGDDSVPFRTRVRFIIATAEFLRHAHGQGVRHRDLKSSNLLVREEGEGAWRFFLVDVARVQFAERLSDRARIKNLAQLNASMPKLMNWADRLRFFRHYARGGLGFRDKASGLQRVIAITRGRSCVWERDESRMMNGE